MSWIEIKSENDLPEEGKYVLARHNRGTWIDSDDQANVNCVVVKLVRGISVEERGKMERGDLPQTLEKGWCLSEGWREINRSQVYRSEDEDGNNEKPYNWESFGAGSFFGQSITHWMPIPPLE